MNFGILSIALSGAALLFAAGFAQAQMTVSGSFDVSKVGAATYSVPIQVPPGMAGLEPGFSLNYNSRFGNGLIGVGWSLSGISSITRCPQTWPQDGVKGAITYGASDRFCLDGRRLVLVAGTYGAAASEYRTEFETFAKVTAFGTSPGGGPLYFVVKTRDGLTIEFGNSADSSVAVVGKSPQVVRVWAANKVSDVKGNSQRLSYVQTASGSHLLSNIEYAGNPDAGLGYVNSVLFGYEARPDTITGFQAGYPVGVDQRLKTIETRSGGQLIMSYEIKYDASADRSVMSELRQCSTSGACLASTLFGYSDASSGAYPVNSVAVNQAEPSSSAGPWFGFDVNGDGKTDLIHLTALPGTYRIWKTTADAQFEIVEHVITQDTELTAGKWVQIDIDGDGLADLIHVDVTPGYCRYWRSNGNGTFAVSTCQLEAGDVNGLYGFPLAYSEWIAMDVNGDGYADLVHLSASGSGVGYQARIMSYLSNGDGIFSTAQYIPGNDTFLPSYGSHHWKIFDANGDGLPDLVHIINLNTTPASVADVYLSSGNGSFVASDHLTSNLGGWYAVDLNGDGLVDLTQVGGTSGRLNTFLSKGDGTFVGGTFVSSTDPNVGSGSWQALDTNGDGLVDFVHTPASLTGGGFYVWRSKGDGTFDVVLGSQAADIGCATDCAAIIPGDFQGTGAPGFVRLEGSSTNSAVTVKSAWLMGAGPRGLLTSVSNGLGGRLYWSYTTLPKGLGTSYFKELPSNGTALTVVSALPVVTSVESVVEWSQSANRGHVGHRRTDYSYGSARVERNGRGFVGFNWMQSKEADTGLTARTYFHQTFPYIGMPYWIGRGKGVGVSGWRDLSYQEIYSACVPVVGNDPCPVAAGNRYFPYAEHVHTQSWDIDGTALPRKYVYTAAPDAYGNFLGSTVQIQNPDGSATPYSTVTTSTYFNDPNTWVIGRLLKREVVTKGPDVAAPVVPGSGGLPAAPAPSLPAPLVAARIAPILLQLLLGDD